MLCWLPVFVPTCSVDQVNWLICLEVGCQALMALDKQPVQCFALQPFWGLPQVLLSWPRGAEALLPGNMTVNVPVSQGFCSHCWQSSAVAVVQGTGLVTLPKGIGMGH